MAKKKDSKWVKIRAGYYTREREDVKAVVSKGEDLKWWVAIYVKFRDGWDQDFTSRCSTLKDAKSEADNPF